MLGVGLDNELHWAVLAVGLGITAFGAIPACTTGITYLTDAYTGIIADAPVGVTFVRNVISTVFVFAAPPWKTSIGMAGFFVSYAVVVSAWLLGTFCFIFCGRSFRVKLAGKYRRYTAGQVDAGRREGG